MELPAPKDNQVLFLDMNSFFASCEQHRHPELRGKPVGVSPVAADSGCVLAASYEAKKFGVKTGTRVGEAKAKVPSITILPADPKYYVQIHNRIAQFLEQEIGPNPVRMSIDEFYLPLDKTEQWTPNAHALAHRIKLGLKDTFSPALKCSIGVGPNLFLGKLGTEVHKPNGLAILQLHTLKGAYGQLQLRDIPGINWGMSNTLNSMGIRTPVDFYNAPRQFLHSRLGIMGDAWWYNLHGYKVDYRPQKIKSISHSHVLAPRLRTKAEARAVLYKLWLKVADRLREKNLATTKVYVKIRSFSKAWRYVLPVRPTHNPFLIFNTLAQAYDCELPKDFVPMQVYIVAMDLEPHQSSWLGIFPEDSPKADYLFEAVDSINTQFGRWTIKPASLLKINDAAPNRITFRTPDYEMD